MAARFSIWVLVLLVVALAAPAAIAQDYGGYGLGAPAATSGFGLPPGRSAPTATVPQAGAALQQQRARTFIIIPLMRGNPETIAYALGADDVIYDQGAGGYGGGYGGGGYGSSGYGSSGYGGRSSNYGGSSGRGRTDSYSGSSRRGSRSSGYGSGW